MVMTSSSHIKPWLLGWTQQLRGWAEDGSLLAAAQQALLLEGEPKQLVELLDQWGASDFSALPAVETLSNQDIAGARGAYVEDLSQIFLNQEWLAEASASPGATRQRLRAAKSDSAGLCGALACRFQVPRKTMQRSQTMKPETRPSLATGNVTKFRYAYYIYES